MKFLIAILLSFQPILVFAECNPRTGIVRLDSERLQYNNDCHKEFGLTRKNLSDAEGEIVQLRKTIELKDLMIEKSDEQVDLWMKESIEQNKRLNNIKNASEKNKWLWFGLGVLATGAAVYGAGQLSK